MRNGKPNLSVRHIHMPCYLIKGCTGVSQRYIGKEHYPCPDGTENSQPVQDQDGIQHGLVIEWFGDLKEIDVSHLDIPMALAVARALHRIHAAGVCHGDLQE